MPYKNKDEFTKATASKVVWSAVKKKYKKFGDSWKMESCVASFVTIESYSDSDTQLITRFTSSSGFPPLL